MIKVLFFAQLREVLETAQLEIAPCVTTVADLRAQLQARGQLWQEYLAFNRALVAVNQIMENDQALLNDGDEVAFFPPVTGG